ncbi:MAG TPA: hypothetical protein VEV44_15210 [Pseudoneobacillus sp.]|nr:hypothetical protein [Pseudoneobacillus sp.]
MKINLKDEMIKIEIPKNLHARVELGVSKAMLEKKKKSPLMKRGIISAGAAVVIIGTSLAFGGSQIAGAMESLIHQIFGSKEELKQSYPIASDEDLVRLEKHLELASNHFTKEEFIQYSLLQKEAAELVKKMTVTENGNVVQKTEKLSPKDQARLNDISKKLEKYETKLDTLTTHTLVEAQNMVDYPINKPGFIPDGYQLLNIIAHTEEEHPNQNPIVEFEYRKGEFGYKIFQLAGKQDDELDRFQFDQSDSYTLDGYQFDFHYSNDTNVQGMRVTNSEQNYKIVIIADILAKEEMEKILLSMMVR